jgi:hypothetical protein
MESMTKQETGTERELIVELINSSGKPEQKRFKITPQEGYEVNAGELKQSFLGYFDEASAILEPEVETDENRSYHLLGLDHSGKRTAFADGDKVDLNCYTQFRLAPRTTGGGRKRWP